MHLSRNCLFSNKTNLHLELPGRISYAHPVSGHYMHSIFYIRGAYWRSCQAQGDWLDGLGVGGVARPCCYWTDLDRRSFHHMMAGPTDVSNSLDPPWRQGIPWTPALITRLIQFLFIFYLVIGLAMLSFVVLLRLGCCVHEGLGGGFFPWLSHVHRLLAWFLIHRVGFCTPSGEHVHSLLVQCFFFSLSSRVAIPSILKTLCEQNGFEEGFPNEGLRNSCHRLCESFWGSYLWGDCAICCCSLLAWCTNTPSLNSCRWKRRSPGFERKIALKAQQTLDSWGWVHSKYS